MWMRPSPPDFRRTRDEKPLPHRPAFAAAPAVLAAFTAKHEGTDRSRRSSRKGTLAEAAMTGKPSFYVEPPQDIIDWARSPEGRAAIRNAEEAIERAVRELDEARRLTREMLLEPMTL